MYERTSQSEIDKRVIQRAYGAVFWFSIIQAYLSIFGAIWILIHSEAVATRFKQYSQVKNKYRLFALGAVFNVYTIALAIEFFKVDANGEFAGLVYLAPMPFAVWYAKWNGKTMKLADGVV